MPAEFRAPQAVVGQNHQAGRRRFREYHFLAGLDAKPFIISELK